MAVAFDRMEEVLRLSKERPSWTLDCRDNKGRTPLHVAAEKGIIRCGQVLVEAGADKNARCNEGRTALYRAAVNGDRPMVEMLIQMGADPTVTDHHGRSALDVAREEGHVSCFLPSLFGSCRFGYHHMHIFYGIFQCYN